MYVGRIVAVGKTKKDNLTAMYRVSSRSFPNRRSKLFGKTVSIIPKEEFETDVHKNPYIAYNCLRLIVDHVVVGNGTHVDPIAEKLETGMRMRDAVISVLYGMDFEHDSLNTPRITAAIDRKNKQCVLGIIRQDALLVQGITPETGNAYYLATYEHNYPSSKFCDGNFDVHSTEEACDYIIGRGVFADMERPISAACALETDSGFSIAYKDVNISQ